MIQNANWASVGTMVETEETLRQCLTQLDGFGANVAAIHLANCIEEFVKFREIDSQNIEAIGSDGDTS